jgi:PAS domain S-box-containing protein
MRRLIAVLVVLCLAPLALLTWFSVSLSARAVRGQVDARVRNTAAASAVYVNEQMDGLTELVGSYAKRPSMVAAMGRPAARRDGDTIAFHLDELQGARAGLAIAFVTDPDGRLIDIVPPTPSILGWDFSFLDWYQGVTATDRPYLSEAYGLDTIQRFVDAYAAAQGVRLTGRAVSAYEPVPGLGWTVTADVATGTAFAPIAELRRTVLAIGAVLGLALLAGLVLLARALRRQARTERQLKDGQEQTRELLEATAEAFVSIDAGGLVTIWNPQAEKTFGWSAAEAVGRPLAELIVPEASRDAHERGRRRYLETGEGPLLDRRVEVTAVHKDGRRFPVEVVIWAVGSGPETTFNAFAHDISERRRAEEALEQAKQDADRANRAKSEFLSSMSHELRTPLNAILGFGQLLQLEDLTQEQAESVDHILRGGRHLLELINEVLDISRIESGNLSLSTEPVDVLEVVKDTVDLIRPLAAEREITVQAPSPHDPSPTVDADRQRLKQVLLNLASNAVKYNRHAGTIRVACQAAAGGRVAIVVTDTGPGLSADKMARLFRPFDRLGAEQSEVQGTGMGLALSKGLVEAMNGSLTAESVEGQGTTFTVELPESSHRLLSGTPGRP